MSALFILVVVYLVLGAFVGFCAGLLGIGGGLILVPSLYYIFKYYTLSGPTEDIMMHMALATSMAIILPTALSSAFAQHKRKAIDWAGVRLMAPGLVMGSLAGVFLVAGLKGQTLQIIFSVGLVCIAASIILRKETTSPIAVLKTLPCALPMSTLFGALATLLGISGSVLYSPYLDRAGLPLKSAIATGSALGVVVSLTANIGYILAGKGTFDHISLIPFLVIVPVSVLFAPIGVKVSHALPVRKLRIVFAVLLVILAIKMMMEVV